MKKILIVEDEKPLNLAIKMKLEKLGFKVVSVFSAKEAEEVLGKGKPDLIWLDVLLPQKNGLDFLEEIRDDPKLKDIKVLVVSVSGGLEKKEKAKKLGVIDYIVKSEMPLEKIISKAVQVIG